MNEVIGGGRAPGWLRVVAGLGLLWNLFGIYQYLMTVGMIDGAAEAAADATPAWVKGAFAVAVFGGALGCLGLHAAAWSKLLLLLSLLAGSPWTRRISDQRPRRRNPRPHWRSPSRSSSFAILLAWLSHGGPQGGLVSLENIKGTLGLLPSPLWGGLGVGASRVRG